MSLRLVDRNPDLKRLRDEGYELRIVGSYVLVDHVPYVTSERKVKFGTLVCELCFAGDATQPPNTHVMNFAGEFPCKANGSPIEAIRSGSGKQVLAEGVVVDHSFSSKPLSGGYANYYEKMTTYAKILSGYAQEIDKTVTACTFAPVETAENESVFCYLDTASSRAGIGVATDKLRLAKVAILGVGGTGSYVLDLVAKCPVAEIHVFDGDWFLSHNAFRSPGAASLDELRNRPNKAIYWAEKYAKLHRCVIPHDYFIDESNLTELYEMDFIFLCMDKEVSKRQVVGRLLELKKPFIEVGMGLDMRQTDSAVHGSVRTTTASPAKYDHVRASIPLSDRPDEDDLYSKNIQVADLNALNAALAVIRWKKRCGFYATADGKSEHTSIYGIIDNSLVNTDFE